jgi:hypothetical protein
MISVAQSACDVSVPIHGGIKFMRLPLRSLLVTAALLLSSLSASLVHASTVDGILYAADFPGADIGAQVVAAMASCSTGCTVLLPKGKFDFSTPIVLKSGVSLIGQGTGATGLNWVGSGNVVPIEIRYVMRTRIKGFALNRNNSSTTAPAIQVFGGWDTQIDDIWCTANWGVWQEYSGFQGCIWITGTTQAPSCVTRITNSRFENYTQYSIKTDHSTEMYFTSLSSYSYPNNTITDGLVVDTETAALHVDMFACGYGRHCLVVQNTLGGIVPHWLYFNQFEADTTSGGDAIVFDSSLGSTQVAAVFTSSWSGGAGLNDSGGIATYGANGICIDGGSSITWEGRIRRNVGNGILISSNSSSYINIHDSSIYANNLGNSSDGHGIYISGSSTHIGITNNIITNSLDYAGQQRYGIKVSRVRADQLRVSNNDLSNNVSGPFFIANLGPSIVSGNAPVYGGSQMGAGTGSQSGEGAGAASSKGTNSGSPYPLKIPGCGKGISC